MFYVYAYAYEVETRNLAQLVLVRIYIVKVGEFKKIP